MITAAILAAAALFSQPGETMDAFVERIAPQAVAISNRAGLEVCGAIAEADGVYSIRMVQGGPRACTIDFKDVEAGFVSTGQTFHTHPYAPSTRSGFTRADYAAPGYLAEGWTLKHQAGWGTDRFVTRRLSSL